MKTNTKKIAGVGLLTAVVVVLQLLASSIHLGPFSVTLCLAPIIIGAALFGPAAGAWLGFVFSVMVLFTDAGLFLAVSVPGTVLTVLVKGTLAGLLAAFTYKALEKLNKLVAVIVAGIVCPVVNTGIFLIGCLIFFMGTINEWAAAAGLAGQAGKYMITGLVGVNFLVELAINMVLAAVIVRIIKIGKNEMAAED